MGVNSKLIVIIIILVLIIVVAGWYLYYNFTEQLNYNVQTSPNNNIQSTVTATDTTTGILNELNQIPGDTSFDNDTNSLNQDIDSF